MAIKSFEKNGKIFYRVYVNARSKIDRKIRVQKSITEIETLSLARREENRIHQELGKKIREMEGRADSWQTVVEKWTVEAKQGYFGDRNPATIIDYYSALYRWTKDWLMIPACELNKSHGRELIEKLERAGKTIGFMKKIKNIVNVVYNFGIEHGHIVGVHNSPVYGIKFQKNAEKTPEILTSEEIKKFLYEAKRQEHPWYPVWAVALLTGMRSGELYALEWDDLDFENNLIRVSKSFNKRTGDFKSTKAGYWRNIPMSSELRNLLLNLKSSNKESKFALPRFSNWDKGEQAKILRTFLKGIGLPSVKFHALRACFATQLLSKGIPAAIVMKICGWRDLKTMEFYVRVAGVDEKGATDCLTLLPSDADVMENVVSLFKA